MWDLSWRKNNWNRLSDKWDLIIIGGGITGAGIFNLAARRGLKVLLLESKDFSFGTSSKSSKLIHGGLRYIKNRQFDVVKESVKERENLLKEGVGLVEKLGFLFAGYKSVGMSHLSLALGTTIYDLMVPKWDHQIIHKNKVTHYEPLLRTQDLTGAVYYYDAKVDDSRLVLRILQDGEKAGGCLLNYAKVVDLLRTKEGRVCGVLVQDQSKLIKNDGSEVRASIVVNATGPWSDQVRKKINGDPKLRKLRGSHLIFANEKLPINQAVTMLHPDDHRALFAIPWEGTTIIGTTDIDQPKLLNETKISSEEINYLLRAANHTFPEQKLDHDDILSTFSGLRPIISGGANTPSQESRAHAFWEEEGMVTITGGKLTIFRVMASDLLNFISNRLPDQPKFDRKDPIFFHPESLLNPTKVSDNDWFSLTGKYGTYAKEIIDEAGKKLLEKIKPTSSFWAEICWSAKNEAIVHLDDLLLRRIRIGLCLPQGGMQIVEKNRSLIQKSLMWDDLKWNQEVDRYKQIWEGYYYIH